MIIKEFKLGAFNTNTEVTYLEIGKGPLVYFSSDYIPAYIPDDARIKLSDTFRSWQDKVLVFGQLCNDKLTVLSISLEGRLANEVETEHLCERMGLPAARVLYSGPFNKYLLDLTDQALVKCGNSNILWRRE